jgi:hypothetical protein
VELTFLGQVESGSPAKSRLGGEEMQIVDRIVDQAAKRHLTGSITPQIVKALIEDIREQLKSELGPDWTANYQGTTTGETEAFVHIMVINNCKDSLTTYQCDLRCSPR